MNDVFDCISCRHSISRHTIKRWPQLAKGCEICGCTGYQPTYRSRWDEDKEAGAIG